MLKKVVGAVGLAIGAVIVSAGAALAETTYPPSPSVLGGGGGGGESAFTGATSDVSIGAILAVSLLLVGLGALLVARRRAARLAG